jgi:hypothetical protein
LALVSGLAAAPAAGQVEPQPEEPATEATQETAPPVIPADEVPLVLPTITVTATRNPIAAYEYPAVDRGRPVASHPGRAVRGRPAAHRRGAEHPRL